MIPSNRSVLHKKRRRLSAEPLETRRLLAASLGWDGPGLGAAELTYTITGRPRSISQAQVDAAISTAFEAWSSVADVSFTKTEQTGLRDSIDISFVQLDGAGGTLAQAYFPDDVNPARIAGDIQFDLSEVWEIGNDLGNRAFDLTWVAVHEIGHALGLDHSDQMGAILQAFVSPNQSFVSLDSSDVAEIRFLYAAATESTATQEVDTSEDPKVTAVADTASEEHPVEDFQTGLDGNDADEMAEEETEIDDGGVVDDKNEYRGRRHHRRPHVFFPAGLNRDQGEKLFTKFDQDESGSLTEQELPTGIWDRLVERNVDANEDGEITREEIQLFLDQQVADHFDRGDENEDGRLTEDEVSNRLWGKIAAADTDQDQAISLEELQAWRAERVAEAGQSDGNRIDRRVADHVFFQIGRRVRFAHRSPR